MAPRDPGGPRRRSFGVVSADSDFELVEEPVVVVIEVREVVDAVIVVIELTGQVVPVVGLEPVRETVVVVICVR